MAEALTVILRPEELVPWRRQIEGYERTQGLLRKYHRLRSKRTSFFLTRSELDEVFRWKLRGQFGRQVAARAQIDDEMARIVTRAAFEVRCGGDLEARVRLGLLSALPGVEVPVASAVLALCQPRDYCVIDFRGWRAFFGKERRNFTIPQYFRYRNAVAAAARALGWTVQETDLAAWALDEARGSG